MESKDFINKVEETTAYNGYLPLSIQKIKSTIKKLNNTT